MYPFPLEFELYLIKSKKIESPHKKTKSLLDNEELIVNIERKQTERGSNNSSSLTIVQRPNIKEDIRSIGLLMLQLLTLIPEIEEVSSYSKEKIQYILDFNTEAKQIDDHMREILGKLLFSWKETTVDSLL